MKMFSISKKQSVFNFQAQGYINVYIYIYTWICEANKLSTTEYFDQPVKWFEYEVKLRSTWTSQRGGLWVTSTTMCVKSSEVVLWKISNHGVFSRARRVWVMFCTSQWRVLENDYCFSLHASQVVCELLFCLFIRQVKYLDGEWYKCHIIVAGICGSHFKLSDFSRALLPEMFPSREALGRVYFTETESTRSVLASWWF